MLGVRRTSVLASPESTRGLTVYGERFFVQRDLPRDVPAYARVVGVSHSHT